MRFLAFALLVLAAFALSGPWLDRAGVALLGLAFGALAMAPGGLLRSRPALVPFAVPVEAPMPDVEPTTRDLRERVGAYAEDGR